MDQRFHELSRCRRVNVLAGEARLAREARARRQKKAARLTVRPKSREETPKEGKQDNTEVLSCNAQFIVRCSKIKG